MDLIPDFQEFASNADAASPESGSQIQVFGCATSF